MAVDADLEVFNGEICGTRNATGHFLLVEMHFEPVYGKWPFGGLPLIGVGHVCRVSAG